MKYVYIVFFFSILFSCTFHFLFHWWGLLFIGIVTFALFLLLNILFVKMYIFMNVAICLFS